MHSATPIAELMTGAPYCIDANDTVQNAKNMMARHAIRHLPVLDEGDLVGIVSDRDVKLAQAVSADPDFHGSARIADVYRASPYTVSPGTPAHEVLATMAERGIGSALIAEEGRVLGIFTTIDACREFARFLAREDSPVEA